MKLLKHILLVDDDEMDIELIQAALVEYPLVEQIDVVNDGAAALDYLKCEGTFSWRAKVYPEIIVMDLKMPKVNGLEVLQQIRAHPNLQHIPVLILSSSNEPKDIMAAQALKVQGYIVKESGFQQLVDTVKEYAKHI